MILRKVLSLWILLASCNVFLVNLQYAPQYVSSRNITVDAKTDNSSDNDSYKIYRYSGGNPLIFNGTGSGTETTGSSGEEGDIFGNTKIANISSYVPLDYDNDRDSGSDESEPDYGSIDGVQEGRQETFTLGVCSIVINRQCPHPDVKYYLYSYDHPDTPEEIRIGVDPFVSNLTSSSFDPSLPTKIIVHGFNSDMLLHGLIEIKNQYLIRHKYNIFTVDWGNISKGPCYPAAVWNSRFAGRCGALLVERLTELGNHDIHLIGFSLGAHVAAFMANNLRPYRLPRITGLDPALPAFTTPILDDKLDKTDAEFVDVVHTNAFFQGKVEECGHVDFYMNGGSVQPGCWADDRFLACNHHRAAFYFAESINSSNGFWGWYCPSFIMYLLGRCPPQEPQILLGEDIDHNSQGMHLVITDSVAPFAVGRFDGPTIDILIRKSEETRIADFDRFKNEISPECKEDVGQMAPRNNQPPPTVDGLDFSPLMPDLGMEDPIGQMPPGIGGFPPSGFPPEMFPGGSFEGSFEDGIPPPPPGFHERLDDFLLVK